MGGKAFDASRNFAINSVIFQPADLSRDRIEKPIALDALDDNFVRNNLIKKYVHEYFYITPDEADMARRHSASGALARMSDGAVFLEWNEKVAPDMKKLAEKNVLRRVVVNEISALPGSEYLRITYELQSWDVSNDIMRAPLVQKNKSMFIRADFEKGLRQTTSGGAKFDVKKYLESGGDAATIFRFRVLEVVIK